MTTRGVSKTFVAQIAAATVDLDAEFKNKPHAGFGTVRITNLHGTSTAVVIPVINGAGVASILGDDCIHIPPRAVVEMSYYPLMSIAAVEATTQLEFRVGV